MLWAKVISAVNHRPALVKDIEVPQLNIARGVRIDGWHLGWFIVIGFPVPHLSYQSLVTVIATQWLPEIAIRFVRRNRARCKGRSPKDRVRGREQKQIHQRVPSGSDLLATGTNILRNNNTNNINNKDNETRAQWTNHRERTTVRRCISLRSSWTRR